MKTLWLLPLLAGCTATDPLTKSGEWHPVGANEANLRAMIADPHDLTVGRGTQLADGTVVANAVARYRAGKVHDLPDSNVSKVAPLGASTGGVGAVLEGN